jgi:hypothetical protein
MTTIGGDVSGAMMGLAVGVFVQKQQLKAEATVTQLLQATPSATAAPPSVPGVGRSVDVKA